MSGWPSQDLLAPSPDPLLLSILLLILGHCLCCDCSLFHVIPQWPMLFHAIACQLRSSVLCNSMAPHVYQHPRSAMSSPQMASLSQIVFVRHSLGDSTLFFVSLRTRLFHNIPLYSRLFCNIPRYSILFHAVPALSCYSMIF